MNHRINNVTDLFDDSKRLYEELIVSSSDSSADGILGHLKEAVEALKTSWEGKDAGKQINNIKIPILFITLSLYKINITMVTNYCIL